MLRRLYDWVMSLARGPHATWALAVVSFIESSFFPVPPDVMLIPMVLADRKAWWKHALVCTIASVLGALLGYAIGALLFETIGQAVINFYHAEHTFERLVDWYDKWGAIGILAGAITPLPYKVLTIFSGTVGFAIPLFIIVSIIGRGLRFFVVAGLLYFYGEPIREFIERRLGLLFILFVIVFVAGFAAIALLK